jgi:hypothetical protein
MSKGSPGMVGIVGLVAFYGVFRCLNDGRLKLNRYGDDHFLTWDADPVLFGGSVVVFALIGVTCLWYWWTHRG